MGASRGSDFKIGRAAAAAIFSGYRGWRREKSERRIGKFFRWEKEKETKDNACMHATVKSAQPPKNTNLTKKVTVILLTSTPNLTMVP